MRGIGKGVGNVFHDPPGRSLAHSVDSIPNCRVIYHTQFSVPKARPGGSNISSACPFLDLHGAS